jgi:TM2 domain-containing membrane protein YozV
MYSNGMAYLLWLPCCLFICGLHRFYLGKPISGIIWFFTFGLIGFGQFIDLFLIPGMVAQANGRFGYGGNNNVNTVIVNVGNRGRRRRRDDDYDDEEEEEEDDRPRRRRRS